MEAALSIQGRLVEWSLSVVCWCLMGASEGDQYRQLIGVLLRLIRFCSASASITAAKDSSAEVMNFMMSMAFILSEMNICMIDSVGLRQRSLLGSLNQ